MLCGFKKDFDLIWHEGLLYKLIESGVEGKTYNVITSMYTNNKCEVKMGKKHTFAEFCKNILCVQCKTPNNACTAELGQYPLMIKIQAKAVKFYNHLKGSDSLTFHNKVIPYREMNLEKSPLSKLVLGLCSQTQTDPTEPQDSNTIRPNQIMRKQKDNYLTHWKESTKLSKLESYLVLNREYTVAEYLTTVTQNQEKL